MQKKKNENRKCTKGRLKKPTKSGRICRKKRKSSNRPYIRIPSNCVGLGENVCNSDPNCIYRHGKKHKSHCAAKPGGYGAYEGPKNKINRNQDIIVVIPPSPPPPPQPVKINTDMPAIVSVESSNNKTPVGSTEWACVNPYNSNEYNEKDYNNSCIKGGVPASGYEDLPRSEIGCKRACKK